QNYPNPFNPATKINFSVKETAKVELIVYNMQGQEVARLIDGIVTAGNHKVKFNASNLPSGVYCYRLRSNEFTSVKKMLLIK
ncbi:MAG: T9SS type A sorting domain-containing protein, partial [bacterium]